MVNWSVFRVKLNIESNLKPKNEPKFFGHQRRSQDF